MVLFKLVIAGDADYDEINLTKFDVLLRFDEMNRWHLFPVTINDDDLLESTENFNLELRFDPFITRPSGVILSPNVSTVYIEDDDGNSFILATAFCCLRRTLPRGPDATFLPNC